MAPRKKTSTMIWVKKTQHTTNLATDKKTSSDCSLLSDSVSALHLSSSPSEKMAKPAARKEEHTWSLLPEELLHIIYKKLDNCFDVIHARSVCHPWRATFPFPAYLLRPSYSLPSFNKFPRKSKGSCTLEKIPLFLFRVRAPLASTSSSEFFIGGINGDKSKGCKEPLSISLQCSVKVKTTESDTTTFMNMLDCQILPLGYQYRMIGWDRQSLSNAYNGVAFLPLNKEKEGGEGEEEFVVLLGYSNDLLVLTSAEMRWMWFPKISKASCKGFVTFRGKFYVVFLNGDISVIDPYSLQETTLPPSERLRSQNYLVPCGNDELFLIEVIIPQNGVLDFSRLALRVSKLDEEAGQWIVVSDLGDRILFIGDLGNFSCSAKDLPDGCGLSGNSILKTYVIGGDEFYAYKYGAPTGNAGDDLNFWRFSRENCVKLLNKSPPVLALRVEL